MKEHPGNDEIGIKLRIHRAHGRRAAHHLRDVFDQTAAARVMIFSRSGGAAEALAKPVDEQLTQAAQARVGKSRDAGGNFAIVFKLALA